MTLAASGCGRGSAGALPPSPPLTVVVTQVVEALGEPAGGEFGTKASVRVECRARPKIGSLSPPSRATWNRRI